MEVGAALVGLGVELVGLAVVVGVLPPPPPPDDPPPAVRG